MDYRTKRLAKAGEGSLRDQKQRNGKAAAVASALLLASSAAPAVSALQALAPQVALAEPSSAGDSVTETVAKIGDTTYTSLAAAVGEVKNGETITLLGPLELASTVEVNKPGVSFTIDLNGQRLDLDQTLGSPIQVTDGKLTIKDSSSEQTGEIAGPTNGAILVWSGGSLVVEGGYIHGSATLDINQQGGTITIKGGSFRNDPSKLLTSDYIATQDATAGNKWKVTPKDAPAQSRNLLGETASNEVVEINDTKYSSLADAVTAVQNGGTITLLGPLELASTVEVNKPGVSFTIDLNGHSIAATDRRALWVKSGDVTLTGEGTVSANKGEGSFDASSSVIRVGDAGANENTAKLTVGPEVTVSSDHCYGVTVFGKNTGATPMELVVQGKVAVTGTESAISGNGSAGLGETKITVEQGAEVSATGSVAIYHPGKGTLTVAGKVSGPGGIEAKAGTVKVLAGAEVTATGTTKEHHKNGNGPSSSGYAIAAVVNGAYQRPVDVKIEGGTIKGAAALLEDNVPTDSVGTGSVVATSDTIATDDGHVWVTNTSEGSGELKYKLAEAVTVTFNSNDGSTVAPQKIEKGKTATKPEDPKYDNHSFEYWYADSTDTEFKFTQAINTNLTLNAKWSTNVASITSGETTTSYSSLAAAVNAVESGQTIKLLGDVALTDTVVIDKQNASFTIDLNGHSIAATDCRALWVKAGDVTLTGEGTVSANKSEGNTSFDASSSVIRVGDASTNNSPAKLIVGPEVTVSSNHCYGITVFGKNTGATPMELVVQGKVAVTGTESAISGNGSAGLGETKITVEQGAEVSATGSVAIYHPGKGTLTVAGKVSGPGGVEAKAGTVKVLAGAEVTATGTTKEHHKNGNGPSSSGYAIAAVVNGAYQRPVDVKIEGGTINGAAALLADDVLTDSAETGSVVATSDTIATDDGHVWVTNTSEGSGELKYKLAEAVTVTFNSNGGSTVAPQKIEKGTKASEPTAPTRSGFKFLGWYKGGDKFDFKSNVNQNLTLAAMWEALPPAPTVDKSKLQAAVTKGKQVKPGDYTAATAKTFSDALKAAQAALDKSDATQAEVDKALKALQTAQDALAKKATAAEKAKLQAAVDAAKNVKGSDYTPTTAKALEDALKGAKDTLAKTDPSQAEVEKALKALQDAQAALVKQASDADKAALKAEVAKAKDLKAADYTPESFQSYEDAVKAAQSVLSKSNPSQAEVEKALKAVKAAQAALAKKLASDVDKTLLQSEINRAKNVQTDDYTPESAKAFQDALKNAQAVLAKAAPSSADVYDALKALTNAQMALVKKPTPTPTPESDGWKQAESGSWFFLRDGEKVKGWMQDADGSWYHFASDGTMDTGWFQDADGSWYLLNTYHDGTFGAALSGWQFVDGSWFFFNPDHNGSFGALQAGWVMSGGFWYYLSEAHDGSFGKMLVGWQQVNGDWYYLRENVGGPLGSCVLDGTTPDGYRVDASGRWIR